MLYICEVLTIEYDVMFTLSKSRSLLICVFEQNEPIDVKLNGNGLPQHDKGLQLGSHMGASSNKANIIEAGSDLVYRVSVLLTTYENNIMIFVTLMSCTICTFCTSFYGSPLWRLHQITLRPRRKKKIFLGILFLPDMYISLYF